jgi:mannose-6-phosphate isomerase-like protein (cupin superfamily)
MEQRRRWYGEVDPEDLDPHKQDEVRGATVVLKPGDALFLPVGWWHVVRALDVSVTLTFTEFGLPNEFGSRTPRTFQSASSIGHE